MKDKDAMNDNPVVTHKNGGVQMTRPLSAKIADREISKEVMNDWVRRNPFLRALAKRTPNAR